MAKLTLLKELKLTYWKLKVDEKLSKVDVGSYESLGLVGWRKFSEDSVQSWQFPQLTATQIVFCCCVRFVKFWPFSFPFWWKVKISGKRFGGGSKLLQLFSSCFGISFPVWFAFVAEFTLSSGRTRQLWNILFGKFRQGMWSFRFFGQIFK